MSGADRRTVLKGAAIAAAVAVPPLTAAGMRAGQAVVVYDSRLPESQAFARGLGGALALDLAEAHRTRFSALRSGLPQGLKVEGLTRWSDLVALRRELARQGLRLKSESRTPRGLHRWTMA